MRRATFKEFFLYRSWHIVVVIKLPCMKVTVRAPEPSHRSFSHLLFSNWISFTWILALIRRFRKDYLTCLKQTQQLQIFSCVKSHYCLAKYHLSCFQRCDIKFFLPDQNSNPDRTGLGRSLLSDRWKMDACCDHSDDEYVISHKGFEKNDIFHP